MALHKVFNIFIVAIICVSCSIPAAEITQQKTESPTLSPSPILPQTLSPSSTKTVTLTPTITPTITPTPIDYSLGSISLENTGEWYLIDPRIATLPELIIPDGIGFRLRTDWEVGAITYLYVWSGIADSIVDYQTVRWDNGTYKIAYSEVDSNLVSILRESIQDLYPSPVIINTITHTDDYPHWKLEMVGKDGNRIQLISDSNTESAVPWNIIYNGRIYISWNRNILPAIKRLYGTQIGVPVMSFYPDIASDNLPITSLGIPPQLIQGFSGLLPISKKFSYTFDPKEDSIEGNIDTSIPITTFGSKIHGKTTELKQVQITLGKETVDCPVRYDTDRNSLDVLIYGKSERQAWRFTCSLINYDYSSDRRIPIALTFGTDENEQIITRGELFGIADDYPDRVFIPIPDHFNSILANNEDTNDLMQDHIIKISDFIGDVDLTQNAPIDGLIAQADLLGQLTFEGKSIRYTVTTPLNIENGEVIRFDLNRNKFNLFLSKVLQNPLVQRVLRIEPAPILNLWYAEAQGDAPELPFNEGGLPPYFSYELPECPSLYSGGEFPSEENPFQGFGFNSFTDPRGLQFLVVADKVLPVSLFLSPYYMPENLLFIMTPQELKIDNHQPIGKIDMMNSKHFFPYETAILVKWDPVVLQPEDIRAYKEKIQSSNYSFVEIENGYFLEDAVFWILDDGSLEIRSCR